MSERNRHPVSIREVRKYFVDPRNPASADDLAQLSADSVRAMAQIYATGGRIEDMDADTQKLLRGDGDDELQKVVGRVLRREADTRIFDHRFMGQIHPQGNQAGILANLIAAYMNTNLIVREVSQSEHDMEIQVVRWMSNMFGYDPEQASGNITTGGTTANYAAIMVARKKTIKRMWEQDEKKPRKNQTPLYVLTSRWRHYSVDKVCDHAGLRLVTIPSRGGEENATPADNFKMSPHMLERGIERIRNAGGEVAAIVGLAGETETGIVEDLDVLADIAERHEVFLHVDAAYGGPFVFSREKGRFKGIGRADSITTDPHKMLYTPYPAGAVLFREKSDHGLLHADTRYLGVVGARIEGSMGSAGVISTWATIELLGESGIASILNHTLDLADHAYDRVDDSETLRPVFEPELNTLLVGLKPKVVDRVVRATAGSGEVEDYDHFIETVRDGVDKRGGGHPYISCNGHVDFQEDGNGDEVRRSAFRYIGMHPHTTIDDVDHLFERVEEEVKKQLNELENK